MAFPTTPTAGQIAVLNGIQYTYSTSTNAWTRVGASGGGNTVTTGTISILNTSAATSVNNGALIVQGGVGILGDVYFNGNLYQGGTLFTSGSTSTTSTFTILNTASSTSSSTGALLVSGGAGIRGNMYVGGGITATNIATLGTGSGSIIGLGVLASQIVQVQGTTPSTSTNTGALQVSGGVGVASSLFVGSSTYITYQPQFPLGYGLTVSVASSQGGTGYADFLKVTNISGGATNPNKSFRLNSAGSIEIINSAYTATILALSDIGTLNVPVPIQVNGNTAINGPAFRAYVDTNQTITSGSQQKVTFGSETFDTNNNFTGSTFTPTVAGYYQFNAVVRLSGTAGTGECMIVLYKTGSEYARGTNESGTEQGANFWSMMVSDIAYANGTTDTFEVWIQQTSAASRTTTAGTAISHFSGVMVRGA